MITETFYKLYFLTDLDKKTSVRIPDGNGAIADSVVKSAIETIADGGAGNKNGVFIEAKKAQRIVTQTFVFDVA